MTVDVSCGPKGLAGEPDVLYRNNGRGGFTDVTGAAGIKDPGYYGFGVLFTDLDNDGWPDIFVANDSTPNFLFHNNRNGTFSETGLIAGVAVSGDGREQAGMGVDAGDFNGDGYLDLVVTHFSHDYTTVYENSAHGLVHRCELLVRGRPRRRPISGMGRRLRRRRQQRPARSLRGERAHLSRGRSPRPGHAATCSANSCSRTSGTGAFRRVTEQVGGALLLEKSSRGAAFGDYDNDGDIDVLVVNLDDRPTLLRNDTAGGGHWMTIGLAGTKSNRDAIGAVVRVDRGRAHADRRRCAAAAATCRSNDRRVHFGLGAADARRSGADPLAERAGRDGGGSDGRPILRGA